MNEAERLEHIYYRRAILAMGGEDDASEPLDAEEMLSAAKRKPVLHGALERLLHVRPKELDSCLAPELQSILDRIRKEQKK